MESLTSPPETLVQGRQVQACREPKETLLGAQKGRS